MTDICYVEGCPPRPHKPSPGLFAGRPRLHCSQCGMWMEAIVETNSADDQQDKREPEAEKEEKA